MEFVVVHTYIPLARWQRMSESDIDRVVSLYSGRLLSATCDGYEVTLEIAAPSTYKYILLNAVLLPYRYI